MNSGDIRQRRFRSTFQNGQRVNNNSGGGQTPPPTSQGGKEPENMTNNHQEPKKSKKKTTILAGIAVALIVAFAGLTGFFAWKYFSEPDEEEVAAQTTSRVLDKAGKLFDLPKDEEPTVAQIQDKSKLKDQNFFDKAKNGDYLILYEEARLAILYREESNRLVNVGPVNIPQAEQPEGDVAGESTEQKKQQEE